MNLRVASKVKNFSTSGATISLSKNLFHSDSIFPKATRRFEPIAYRGPLLSTLPHATVLRFYRICWMYWYRLQIKWEYKKKKVILDTLFFFFLEHAVRNVKFSGDEYANQREAV
jgi:hypothetical protein